MRSGQTLNRGKFGSVMYSCTSDSKGVILLLASSSLSWPSAILCHLDGDDCASWASSDDVPYSANSNSLARADFEVLLKHCSLYRGSSTQAKTKCFVDSMVLNQEANEASSWRFILVTPTSSSSICSCLIIALTIGIMIAMDALEKETSLVASSNGFKTWTI